MIKFKIKQLRLDQKLTQKELADSTGIRLNTLMDLENNKAKTISIEQINTLCAFFDCQPNEIMKYSPNYFDKPIVRPVEKLDLNFNDYSNDNIELSKLIRDIYQRLDSLEHDHSREKVSNHK